MDSPSIMVPIVCIIIDPRARITCSFTAPEVWLPSFSSVLLYAHTDHGDYYGRGAHITSFFIQLPSSDFLHFLQCCFTPTQTMGSVMDPISPLLSYSCPPLTSLIFFSVALRPHRPWSLLWTPYHLFFHTVAHLWLPCLQLLYVHTDHGVYYGPCITSSFTQLPSSDFRLCLQRCCMSTESVETQQRDPGSTFITQLPNFETPHGSWSYILG